MLLPLLTFLPLFVGPILVRAGSTCYAMDGSALTGADIGALKPCNPDAEFSACCTLDNGSSDNDLCLDSGLCLSTYGEYAGFVWANGCTDPSGQSAACPQICDFMPKNYRYNVLQCQPGVFCCRSFTDNSNCCNNTAALVNTTHIGSILLPDGKLINNTYAARESALSSSAATASSQPSSTASAMHNSTEAAGSCPADHTAVVGGVLGGILGATLIGALVAIVLLNNRRITLQHALESSPGNIQGRYYAPEAKPNTVEAEAKQPLPASPPVYNNLQEHYEMEGTPPAQELSNPDLHH